MIIKGNRHAERGLNKTLGVLCVVGPIGCGRGNGQVNQSLTARRASAAAAAARIQRASFAAGGRRFACRRSRSRTA